MSLSQLDYQWFQAINQLTLTYPFFNPFMKFSSKYGEYLFYFGVILYWFFRTPQNRRMVVQAILSACVAMGTNYILGILFYRDRPFVQHQVNQLIQHTANSSFPSNHAAGAFVIATSIFLWRKRGGSFWLLFAACVAFSRVWTGVHYPLDVVGGIIIGVGSALFIDQAIIRVRTLDQCIIFFIKCYEKIERKVWNIKQSNIG